MAPSKKQRRAADERAKRFLALKRSKAATKGWETRRKNERAKVATKKKAAATRATNAAIAALEKKAKSLARKSKSAAQHARTEARGFKAELKKAKSLQAKRELAKRAQRTAERAPGQLPKLAPESERVELAQAAHYAEGRVFKSGHSLTGYLDGRPGVQRVLTIAPLLAPECAEVTAADREEAQDVIEDTDWSAAHRSDDDYEEALAGWVDAYLAADDGGAFIESDVDSDSAGSDGA